MALLGIRYLISSLKILLKLSIELIKLYLYKIMNPSKLLWNFILIKHKVLYKYTSIYFISNLIYEILYIWFGESLYDFVLYKNWNINITLNIRFSQ